MGHRIYGVELEDCNIGRKASADTLTYYLVRQIVEYIFAETYLQIQLTFEKDAAELLRNEVN